MILGFTLAILIGLCFGFFGSGGPLIVPVLTSIFRIDPKLSLTLSLVISGFTSLMAIMVHSFKGNLPSSTISVLIPSSFIGFYFGGQLALKLSPKLQLILFLLIMTYATFFLFKKGKFKIFSPFFLIFLGFLLGLVLEFIQIAPELLVLPILVALVRLPLKKGIVASLFFIALFSFSSLLLHFELEKMNWYFLGKFILASGIGAILGTLAGLKISPLFQRKMFAIFFILVSFFIIYNDRKILGLAYANHQLPGLDKFFKNTILDINKEDRP